MDLPKEFKERMKKILGDEEALRAFLASFEAAPVRSLRVNTLKTDNDEFETLCDFPYSRLPFAENGYVFECDRIGSQPIHHAGGVYVQEPAAMAALECTDIFPGMKVLDVCASPGGKSTQAASKLGGDGVIVSNEIDAQRCNVLAQNIERIGVRNAEITNTDSASLAEAFPDYFDLVIVDAPCSGEGMMRKNPLAVSEWSMDNINLCVIRQREILANAARNVKKGGRLLYSTCTFAPEENEMQLAHFLSEHGDFRLIDVNERVADITHDGLTEFDGEKLPPDMKKCRRFYPHVFSGEGQFMALLERNCENNEENTVRAEKNEKKRKKDERKPKDTSGESVIFEFLHDVLTPEGICEAEKYRLIQRGNIYYLAPNISDTLPDRCVKSPGVPVGELQKGRVIPHHNFFMAYGSFFKRKIVLAADDGRVVKYLHGESIECNAEKGFAAVTFGKAVLGGAKVSGNEAKNYYPKGLRI